MTRANALWVVCMVDLARSPPLTKTFSVDRLRPFVENLRPSKPPQPSVEARRWMACRKKRSHRIPLNQVPLAQSDCGARREDPQKFFGGCALKTPFAIPR